MIEIWMPVKDFEGFYEVSNLGRKKNSKRKNILKCGLDTYGYKQVVLCKDGKRFSKKIHRLVALCFIPNPHQYNCINHIDENKLNNNANNLEWCTVAYNNNYGTRLKRSVEKRSKPVAQISNGEIIAIYKSAVEANNITGINYSKIRMCCRNERKKAGGYEWKNI